MNVLCYVGLSYLLSFVSSERVVQDVFREFDRSNNLAVSYYRSERRSVFQEKLQDELFIS